MIKTALRGLPVLCNVSGRGVIIDENAGQAETEDRQRPRASKALALVSRQPEIDDVDTDRISVRVLASGQVAYKVYVAGEDDYVGGVATVPE